MRRFALYVANICWRDGHKRSMNAERLLRSDWNDVLYSLSFATQKRGDHEMGYIFTKFGVENIKRERKQHMYNGFSSMGATFQSSEKMSKPTHPNPNLSYLSPPKKKIGLPVLFSQNNRDIQTRVAVDLYWLSVFITSKGTAFFAGIFNENFFW